MELTLYLKSLETKPMNIGFPNLLKETTWMWFQGLFIEKKGHGRPLCYDLGFWLMTMVEVVHWKWDGNEAKTCHGSNTPKMNGG